MEEDAISFIKARGDVYKFLSVCFCQPDKDVFLQENLFPKITAGLKVCCPKAVEYASDMESAFVNLNPEEALVSYAKLFIGPFGLLAPPYGSVYLDDKKTLMGDSTIEVTALYEKAGVTFSDDFSDIPDHITVELEFMYYLILRELEELEKNDIENAVFFKSMQILFIERYLGVWAPQFCDMIINENYCDFYTALASCLKIFITEESSTAIGNPIELREQINN